MGLSTWYLGILPHDGCDEGVLGSCHSKVAWRLLGVVATQKRVLQMAGPTMQHGNDFKWWLTSVYSWGKAVAFIVDLDHGKQKQLVHLP